MKKLPVGYRFIPTDSELIVGYLIKKLKNQQFSCNAVVEHDIYRTEPWNLKGNKDDIGGAIDKGYYFVNRGKKTAAGKKNPSRTVKPGDGSRGGFWKATGGEKAIVDERDELVGVKKSLKYFRFASDMKMTNDCEKTGWIMHEYTLPGNNNEFQPWVVCSIRFNGNDEEYKKQHQKLKQKAAPEPMILQQEHDIQEVLEQYDLQGKQQILLPRFKVIDNEEDMNIMQDYAKEGGGQGGELPHTQTWEASSSAMSGAAACSSSSSANYYQDVPLVPTQYQLTDDNNNNAHDYCGFQEWERLDTLMWTADDGYSYGCHSDTAVSSYQQGY